MKIVDLDSHAKELSKSRVRVIQLAPEERRPQPSPDFILGQVPAALAPDMYASQILGSVRCYTFDGFSIATEGLVLDGDIALSTLSTNHPANYVTGLAERIVGLPRRRIAVEAVVLMGPGDQVFGHWLIDLLPRLYVLQSCGYELASLAFIVSASRPAFVDPLLAFFGIQTSQLIAHDCDAEVLEVDTLVIPSNLRRGPRLHPMFRAARNALLSNVRITPWTGRSNQKLFIARRGGTGGRRLENRRRIEYLAGEEGFYVIDSSTLPFGTQLSLFRSARTIVGEYGSAMHWTMFCEPGIVACALRGDTAHPGFIQTELAHLSRQVLGYTMSPTTPGSLDQGFSLPENDFLLALQCCEAFHLET